MFNILKNNFQRNIIFVIAPFLWCFLFSIEGKSEYGTYGLFGIHLISSFYFAFYVAERFKLGYSGEKLVLSIFASIFWFCLINATYYQLYYFLDKKTFLNVPDSYLESIPEFLFFSIGNMFYNNLTEIKAANLFSKSIIHFQMLISFAILVLILSFIKKEPEN